MTSERENELLSKIATLEGEREALRSYLNKFFGVAMEIPLDLITYKTGPSFGEMLNHGERTTGE